MVNIYLRKILFIILTFLFLSVPIFGYEGTGIYVDGKLMGDFEKDNIGDDNLFKIAYGKKYFFDDEIEILPFSSEFKMFSLSPEAHLNYGYLKRGHKFLVEIGTGLIVQDIRGSQANVSKLDNYTYELTLTNQFTTGVINERHGIEIFLANGKMPNLQPVFSSNSTSISVTLDAYPSFYSKVDFLINDKVVNTIDGSKTSTTIENLAPNREYNIRIRASPVDGLQGLPYDKTFLLRTTNIPLKLDQDITSNSNTITFPKDGLFQNANFEIKFGTKKSQVIDNEHLLSDLSPETDYMFSVRFYLNGYWSDWIDYNFRTLAWIGVPEKVRKISVVDYSSDFITVKIEEPFGASEYEYYLDDVLIDNVSDLVFTYTSLKPSTNYKLSVKAINDSGSSDETFIFFTTKEPPLPTVSFLTSTIIDSENYLLRKVSWNSSNVNDGFKLLVDDTDFKDVDKDVNSMVIDFSTLGYTEKDIVRVEVIPLDPGGIGAKTDINLFFKGVGLPFIDSIIIAILNGLDLMRISGVILILRLIPFVIIFMFIMILFKKYKFWVNSSSSSSSSNNGFGSNTNENVSQRDNSLKGEISRLR